MRTAKFSPREFTRTRSRRLILLLLLCGIPAGVESFLVRYVAGIYPTVDIAPQVSALWPYGSFHDVRWVLVYHRSWAQFVVFSLVVIGVRGLFSAALISLCWPPDVPRPGMRLLIRRNVIAAALLAGVLSPWAALSVALADVSLGVFLLGEIVPLLALAPFFQRTGTSVSCRARSPILSPRSTPRSYLMRPVVLNEFSRALLGRWS